MKNTPFKPKKFLGQHFLTSHSAVLTMVKSSNIKKEDIILEIGPGKGVLTKELLKHSKNVVVIEKDAGLIPTLTKEFSREIEDGLLKIINGDVLEQDISTFIPKNKKYKLVANIPYYITGEILRKFLTDKNKPSTITFLVQKEVAERITGKNQKRHKENTKESILSLSVKLFGTPSYITTVKKGSFYPIPKVDSAILHISITNNPTEKFEKLFFNLIKSGFSSKRKKVFSNLSDILEKETLEKIFTENNIDKNIRAEDLNIDKWKNLTQIVLENNLS